jgi:predicted AlkP superfamily phosphohydrolase/phosphomutase
LVALYDEANMMVVSDHGFGSQLGCFYLNSWLERHGFLVRRKRVNVEARRRIRDFFMKKFLLSLLSIRSVRRTSLQRILKRFDRKVTVESQIDFEKSVAFALGHTIPFGAIYLNVKGREPCGFVEAGKQYEQIKAAICGKLVNLGRELNRKLEVTILEPQKVYSGDKVNLAPDILFTINDWECVVIKSFADYVFTDSPYSNRHTGSHRMHGIFVSYGPDIRKGGVVEDIRIYDIAPTILHMFNSRIADNSDGRVLTEVFLKGSETARRRVKQFDPCETEKERISEKIKAMRKAKKI